MREIITKCEKETELAGERFGAAVPDGAVVAMSAAWRAAWA